MTAAAFQGSSVDWFTVHRFYAPPQRFFALPSFKLGTEMSWSEDITLL